MMTGSDSLFVNNYSSICSASAIFVGVYEPTKQKLLQMFPENLTAVAHLVSLNAHITSFRPT